LYHHLASSQASKYNPASLDPHLITHPFVISLTMFGALNRFIGRLDGEPDQQPRNGPNDNAFGFQVLRNKDPELPLEPWFDFIVGINGHTIVCLQK
jgi:hypothetical protein